MKMNLKNIIFILGVLFLGSSCENFLDVHPKGEVTGKELLKDRKGFENALYGVYMYRNASATVKRTKCRVTGDLVLKCL